MLPATIARDAVVCMKFIVLFLHIKRPFSGIV
jgi:hypothetical protein